MKYSMQCHIFWQPHRSFTYDLKVALHYKAIGYVSKFFGNRVYYIIVIINFF